MRVRQGEVVDFVGMDKTMSASAAAIRGWTEPPLPQRAYLGIQGDVRRQKIDTWK
jgi:hypothetical protein